MSVIVYVMRGAMWDLHVHMRCILEIHCFTVAILSGVTLDIFQYFGLDQEGYLGGWELMLDSQYEKGK